MNKIEHKKIEELYLKFRKINKKIQIAKYKVNKIGPINVKVVKNLLLNFENIKVLIKI